MPVECCCYCCLAPSTTNVDDPHKDRTLSQGTAAEGIPLAFGRDQYLCWLKDAPELQE